MKFAKLESGQMEIFQRGLFKDHRFTGFVYNELVEASEPLEGYLNLREILGASNVFLLESCAGPRIDNRMSFIGIIGPLEISGSSCLRVL